MSDSRTQAIVLLYWTMLLSGAALSGFGLCHKLVRYREWRLADRNDEGEIVFGDDRIGVGLSVTLAPGERVLDADSGGVAAGRVVSISGKNLVIALDPEAAGLFAGDGANEATTRRAGANRTACSPPIAGGWAAAEQCRYFPEVRQLIGSRVTVTAVGQSEIYRFAARVRDVRFTDGSARVFLARPTVLTRIQRRRHARVRLSVPATFERVWPSDSDLNSGVAASHVSAPRHGTVRDLSGGGLRAQLGGVLRIHELDAMLGLYQPGSTVRIGLPFPALSRNSVVARICSSERAVTVGGLTLQVACEFLPMPTWEQEIVIQHVFRLQREQFRTEKMRRHGSEPGVRQ